MIQTRSEEVSEVLQLFSGLEANRLARRDGDFDSGFGIPSYATLAVADLKDAESSKLDSLASRQCQLHLPEDGLDGLCRLDSRDFGGLCDAVYEVGFYHVGSKRRRSVAAGFWAVNDA